MGDRKQTATTATSADKESSMKVDGAKEEKTGWVAKMKQMDSDQWYPMHTPHWTTAGLILIASVFIPLGSLIIMARDDVAEVSVAYGDALPCTYARRVGLAPRPDPTPPEIPDACDTSLLFNIPNTLKAPVYLYYRLEGFNQNFRAMVRSRSDAQLQGATSSCTCEDAVACKPYERVAQSTDDSDYSIMNYDNTTLRLRDLIYTPCGHIAWAMFNDSFVLRKAEADSTYSLVCNTSDFTAEGAPLSGSDSPNLCSKRGIAWSGDVDTRIVDPRLGPRSYTNAGYTPAMEVRDTAGNVVDWGAELLNGGYYWNEWGHVLPTQTDLDFMVWARSAALEDFNKLMRVINVDIPAGTYRMDVNERYPPFGGTKRFVLATRSWVGADNTVLGAGYVTAGVLAVVFAVVVMVLAQARPEGGHTAAAFEALEG